jgi:hypothetical protein
MYVRLGQYKDDGEEREVHVVIHHYDTWNMDESLAHVVLPMLKQLKETKHGAPFVDMPDRPEHLQCYKEPEDYETDKFHFQAWDWVLGEMIFAFETKVGELENWEEMFHDTSEVPDLTSVGVGPAQLRLFPDEDGATEDYEFYEYKSLSKCKIDWNGRKKYQERISNGFRLFGKYYENLWD